MKYGWKGGWRIGGIHPQTAGDELERIRKQSAGRLTAQTVVEEARPVASPLHPAFEWVNSKAATSWREHQARLLINHVTVVLDGVPEDMRPIRAFVNIGPGERFYTSVAVVARDPEMRASTLRQAWGEFEAFQTKYRELEEFFEIWDAAPKVKRRVRKKVDV